MLIAILVGTALSVYYLAVTRENEELQVSPSTVSADDRTLSTNMDARNKMLQQIHERGDEKLLEACHHVEMYEFTLLNVKPSDIEACYWNIYKKGGARQP